MPEITSAVVHQSVEAPQIEPLSKETDPYKDYDLVANKPAVVLLSLKPPQNIEEKREYKISLEENHQEIITKCSNNFHTIQVTTRDNKFEIKEKNCKLINRDFRNKTS